MRRVKGDILIRGIGCVILLANEPAKLSNWYSTVLGLKTVYDDRDQVFYGAITDPSTGARIEFGIRQAPSRILDGQHAIMLNYRVNDLDAILRRIQLQHTPVEAVVEQSYGRFVQITDPEGNAIQLWQPVPLTGGRAKQRNNPSTQRTADRRF